MTWENGNDFLLSCSQQEIELIHQQIGASFVCHVSTSIIFS